jgi:hypothetical protein
MSVTTQILLRAARDRVIDLLGLGETYPLQDTAVSADRLTVAFGTSAKIRIFPGQTDVDYTLRDHQNQTVTTPTPGTGGDTVVTTPPIKEDQTFRIFASKVDTFASKIDRQDFLTQVADVKVGLDATLNAFISAPLLDPHNDHPASSDPRITDYGSTVTVKVEESQEGVDYNLAVVTGDKEVVVSQQDVRGNLDTIVLKTKPVGEDVELRVRATKRFDPSEGRQDQTALLDLKMPLMVRARTDLAVSAQPIPLGFGKDAAVVIAGTQVSARYVAYIRTLADQDFAYGLPPNPSLLPVNPNIQVMAPKWTSAPFTLPDGYAKIGDYQAGTGGDLRLSVPGLVEDSVLIVEARKEHGASKTPSSVQLQQPALVPVQPNPSPALAVEVTVDNNAVPGPLLVASGQPGVYYFFRVGDSGKEILPPAYFHKLDATDPTSNKGINQLRIGIDLALARDPNTPPADLAHTSPLLPLLDLGPQALDITLFVRAMKARSGVDVPLSQTALVPALPVIKLDQETVPIGTAAKIVVTASVKGESYRPFLIDGTPVAAAQDGTGADLSFTSQPLTQSTTFLVRVKRPGSAGIPVTRTVSFTAKVQ